MTLPTLPERIIDFHVHLFPDRLSEAIWKRFVSDYGWPVLHRLYYRDCLAYLGEHGVAPVVYSNYAHRRGVARELNDWNLKVLDEFPGLYCFAACHPDDEDMLYMAEKLLEHPRILGFKLQLLVQRFYPHDPRMNPLYELVMERNKRLLFHVGTGPVGNDFVGAVHFQKVLERYPGLPAIVAHMGALEYEAFGGLLEAYPNLYMDTSFSFLPGLGVMFNLDSDFLERYQDRILYGSDFPNIIFPREDEINQLLSMGLSPAFYRKVFRENGLHLISQHAQDLPKSSSIRSMSSSPK